MELLTVQETAELLRVSPATVRRYIANGALPARRVGRSVRVEKDAAERFAQPYTNGSHANGATAGRQNPPDEPPRKRSRKPRYLTYDDPIWSLVGIATGPEGEPTDVARNKHKYLAEEYAKGLRRPIDE